MTATPNEWMTRKEAAKYACTTEKTLAQLAYQHRGRKCSSPALARWSTAAPIWMHGSRVPRWPHDRREEKGRDGGNRHGQRKKDYP